MITLYGASGHAKVVRELLLDQGLILDHIIDENPDVLIFKGIEVKRPITLHKSNTLVIAIGDNEVRKKLALLLDVQFPEVISHSSSMVSNSSKIGRGTVVMPKVTINPDCTIGEHCIINTAAIIEHDCTIGSYSHISPGAILTGGVTIGEGTHIGAGAVILPGVHIGSWTKVGAGAVVLKDIPSTVTAVGNPAVIINKRNE